MPRYELVQGTSSKFWEIKLSGTSFTTTYGRIGTTGQTTLKEYRSVADAKNQHDKLIAAKRKLGYVLAGGGAARHARAKADAEADEADDDEADDADDADGRGASALGRDSRQGAAAGNRELETAIEDDPYDVSAYMVYADWLQGRGDPRGELISLQLAAETKRDPRIANAAAALIEANADLFLGPLAEHTRTHDGNGREAFTWRFGFIHAAKLSHSRHAGEDFAGSMAEVLEMLLRHPSGRFVTELVFGFNNDPSEDPLDDLIRILARKAPATIRKLHFGDFEYPDETEISWYRVGKLGKLWKAVPRLQSLIVQGGEFELGAIELPELVRAEFRTGGLSGASAKAIASAAWPRIEHLEVWYGDDNYGGTATLADAEALLARADLPRLTSLGLRNTSFTDDLCRALATSRLVPQLTRLDLSMGIMTDAGAQLFAARKAAFRHLAELDVSDNYLSEAGLAALRGVARSVVSTAQRDDDLEYRHPAVGE